MCAFYRPTIYKESLYASPSEKELMMNKKKITTRRVEAKLCKANGRN
jgi:hypothetical protein